jgi:hypothetical protein
MGREFRVVNRYIYARVKIIGYDPPFLVLPDDADDATPAQIYTGFMKKFGLISHMVHAFPILPTKELMRDPKKLYLIETPQPILRLDEKSGMLVQENAITVPGFWFRYNDLPNPVEAILKTVLFPWMY